MSSSHLVGHSGLPSILPFFPSYGPVALLLKSHFLADYHHYRRSVHHLSMRLPPFLIRARAGFQTRCFGCNVRSTLRSSRRPSADWGGARGSRPRARGQARGPGRRARSAGKREKAVKHGSSTLKLLFPVVWGTTEVMNWMRQSKELCSLGVNVPLHITLLSPRRARTGQGRRRSRGRSLTETMEQETATLHSMHGPCKALREKQSP